MRKLWIAAGLVVVLAVVAVVVYQQRSTEQQIATTTPAAEQPAAPAQNQPQTAESQPAPAAETAGPAQSGDRVLGEIDAPVTIIEFASLTCPHCASFHTQTLPELKTAYIDTGKAKLIFRDFPLDQLALRASMLARCVPEDRYFAMLDVLFRSQQEWAFAEDPVAALAQIGRTAGLDQATVEACLNDPASRDKIVAEIQAAQNEYQIESTPTLIINGTKHAGALSFEQMDEILKDLAPDNS